jgi:hypothetical protein
MRLNASASSLLSMNSAKWTCRITAAKAALRNLKAKITSSLGTATTGSLQSYIKLKIARVDRCAVTERDHLVRGATVVVHLPMGGVSIGKGRARAIADEK